MHAPQPEKAIKRTVHHEVRTPFNTGLESARMSIFEWEHMDLEELRERSAIIIQMKMQTESSDGKIFDTRNDNTIEPELVIALAWIHTHF